MQIKHEFSVFEFKTTEVSVNAVCSVAPQFLDGNSFAHPHKIIVEAKNCAKQLVLGVIEISELLRQDRQLAEVSSQVEVAFNPLNHAHRLPLPFSRLVFGHVLERLLLIVKYAKHIEFKSVETRLLGSDGKFVESFETMSVDLQYMLFLLKGLLAIFDIISSCNRFGF